MNPNSKSSDAFQGAEERLNRSLSCPADSGKEIVRLSRDILHDYSSMGLSIDEMEVENVVGIESETDTLDLNSNDLDEDFDHVFRIYKDIFEQARTKIRDRLARLGARR